jgi:D-2-hydroxyacid dehydrogenase (NADP+)
LRPEQLAIARKLRWIHSPAAAVHALLIPELVASNIILTNGRDVHGPVVAEHVIALIFALAKLLPQAVRFQSQHTWGQKQMWESHPRPREIKDATLGLIGLGSIGREVARLASALGMKVIAVREQIQKGSPVYVSQVYPATQIDLLLAQSDYVVLAAPTTPQTRGLMNADRLTHMKSDACLINVGRGPLADELALIKALKENRIGGAALDVFDREPLPADSPLWDLENLLITPHTAGLTDKLWERQYELFCTNLKRFIAGEELLALVDKQKGY